MTDSSQPLADSQEEAFRAADSQVVDFQEGAFRAADSQEEVSRAVDFQEEVFRAVDFQEGASRVADFQEGASRVGVTTFQVADSQEEAAVEVTNTVHHQAHHLLTHRNKVFPLLRSTLVPLEDADSASRIFG